MTLLQCRSQAVPINKVTSSAKQPKNNGGAALDIDLCDPPRQPINRRIRPIDLPDQRSMYMFLRVTK